jgi:hypothetical protein
MAEKAFKLKIMHVKIFSLIWLKKLRHHKNSYYIFRKKSFFNKMVFQKSLHANITKTSKMILKTYKTNGP